MSITEGLRDLSINKGLKDLSITEGLGVLSVTERLRDLSERGEDLEYTQPRGEDLVSCQSQRGLGVLSITEGLRALRSAKVQRDLWVVKMEEP